MSEIQNVATLGCVRMLAYCPPGAMRENIYGKGMCHKIVSVLQQPENILAKLHGRAMLDSC